MELAWAESRTNRSQETSVIQAAAGYIITARSHSAVLGTRVQRRRTEREQQLPKDQQ
jgi:hypothetical protein